MDFKDKLSDLSKKISSLGSSIQTEEATKNAFVMPFLHSVLGYDIFNPSEVIPEYTADVGTKKHEKVDYAILKDGEIQILVECKKFGERLTINHASQLFRYFSVTSTRIAILTNGSVYQFYTDLDAPNKMDEKPFMELDLEQIDEQLIPEIKKLAKDDFNLDDIISTAGELKYLNQIKKLIAQEFSQPSEELVRLFANRVYNGKVLTQKVREQFAGLTKKALSLFLRDSINERIKSALDHTSEHEGAQNSEVDAQKDSDVDKGGLISTTVEELEGFHIVRALLRDLVPVSRIVHRDTQSYFGVLLDDNNRKPICRLHFNRSQKYIGTFDKEKNETRHAIQSLDDIYGLADFLRGTVSIYTQNDA